MRLTGYVKPEKPFRAVAYVDRRNDTWHPACRGIAGRPADVSLPLVERELGAWPKGKSCKYCKGRTGKPIDVEQQQIDESWRSLFEEFRQLRVGHGSKTFLLPLGRSVPLEQRARLRHSQFEAFVHKSKGNLFHLTLLHLFPEEVRALGGTERTGSLADIQRTILHVRDHGKLP